MIAILVVRGIAEDLRPPQAELCSAGCSASPGGPSSTGAETRHRRTAPPINLWAMPKRRPPVSRQRQGDETESTRRRAGVSTDAQGNETTG